MVETLATIGLGDVAPVTTGERIALFFIAPGGIILLAVVVGIARQTIIEEFQDAYKRRRALFKQKAKERREEKRKNKHMVIKVKRGGRGGSAATAAPGSLAMMQFPTMSSMTTAVPYNATLAEPTPPARLANGGRWWGGSWTSGFARRGADVPKAPQSANQSDTSSSSCEKENGSPDLKEGLTLHRSDTMATSASQLKEYEAMLLHHRKDIEDSFKKFRADLAKQERNEFWIKLSVAAALFACFWLLGGAIFSTLENWTYFQGFYFVFVVFSTIG